ncbi:ABC transporter permease [Clostridium pasteurianum]|uniref:ABC-2 type transporter n=1 Tax=Clostridium pasteurianum BC1 TaxID=86416 RepID=R4K4L2_CLOPA|nr:ABC transporter permease [Clostridium pasteurianum]AGK98092.1 ABC-2 type transporter [Clostridium pasteurianum BC1]
MSGFFVMLKSNLKLLFRNKASIFLFLLIPLVSALILKIPVNSDNSETAVFKTSVTVFDNSKSELSKEIINLLNSNSSYKITVYEGSTKDLNSAKEKAVNIANRTPTNGFIYIPSGFSDAVIKGNNENLLNVFTTGTDERVKLLENNINMILSRFNMYSTMAKGDKTVFQQLMKEAAQNKTEEKLNSVTQGEKALNTVEKSQIYNFGYLVAIMSITLMFSGNFIASIFIEEKNNRVLKRIMLTKSSIFNYGMVKVYVAIAALIVQIAMIAISIKLFVRVDVGMNLFEISILILGLGLIFNTLSIALGAIFESLSNSNYLTFFITTITALMSGLYFPLDITPKWMQNVSLLMSQRWVVKTAEQILLGSNQWGIVFGMVVIAYMALFLSIGFLGLKVNNNYKA